MIAPHCLFGSSQRLLMILLFQYLETFSAGVESSEASAANEEHDVVKKSKVRVILQFISFYSKKSENKRF